MRNNMWYITVCMILVLMICTEAFDNELYKLAALALAVLTICVYMVCESRVQRANAPLIIREEPPEERSIPPLRDK